MRFVVFPEEHSHQASLQTKGKMARPLSGEYLYIIDIEKNFGTRKEPGLLVKWS